VLKSLFEGTVEVGAFKEKEGVMGVEDLAKWRLLKIRQPFLVLGGGFGGD
jgi:hypothetical protein